MAFTIAMQAPAPFFVVTSGPGSNTTYTADATGLIPAVATQDINALEGAGCIAIPSARYAGRLLGANMNTTADQAIGLMIPASARFRVTKITVENASVSLTAAAGGVYPAASKGGTALVSSAQAYSSLTGAAIALDLTLATANAVQPAGTPLFLALTTAQGAAATADVYVQADIYE